MKKYYTEIIPYELAVKLKESGFPQKPGMNYYEGVLERYDYEQFEKYHKYIYTGPTYAEAIDWLMEKGWQILFSCEHCVWDACVGKMESDMYCMTDCEKSDNDWTVVANAAIEKALELLKKETK